MFGCLPLLRMPFQGPGFSLTSPGNYKYLRNEPTGENFGLLLCLSEKKKKHAKIIKYCMKLPSGSTGKVEMKQTNLVPRREPLFPGYLVIYMQIA